MISTAHACTFSHIKLMQPECSMGKGAPKNRMACVCAYMPIGLHRDRVVPSCTNTHTHCMLSCTCSYTSTPTPFTHPSYTLHTHNTHLAHQLHVHPPPAHPPPAHPAPAQAAVHGQAHPALQQQPWGSAGGWGPLPVQRRGPPAAAAPVWGGVGGRGWCIWCPRWGACVQGQGMRLRHLPSVWGMCVGGAYVGGCGDKGGCVFATCTLHSEHLQLNNTHTMRTQCAHKTHAKAHKGIKNQGTCMVRPSNAANCTCARVPGPLRGSPSCPSRHTRTPPRPTTAIHCASLPCHTHAHTSCSEAT